MRRLWQGVVSGIVSIVLLCSIVPHSDASSILCGMSLGPCGETTIQNTILRNSQTTGAAATAVVVTIAAIASMRTHVYSVEARCGTAADVSGLTVTDGGVTIWSTGTAQVTFNVNYIAKWNPGLTFATNSAAVITLAACTAGTGTLIIEADQW